MVKIQQLSIALICHSPPQEVWMIFLNRFMFYRVYFIIHDNSQNYQEIYGSKYTNINFIQITNEEYQSKGFIDNDFSEESLQCWYKSLYYFTYMNTSSEHVWFIEDDVFFHSEYTLKNLDTRYHMCDFLSNKIIVTENDTSVWHWYKINTPDYTLPLYNTMTNAVRMSKTMLIHIRNYIEKHGRLFFIEAFLPTVAIKNGLSCKSPDELNHIYFKHDFDLKLLHKRELYHPFSDIYSHEMLRELVDMKSKYDTLIDRITNRQR